jgi:hypothetical protein
VESRTLSRPCGAPRTLDQAARLTAAVRPRTNAKPRVFRAAVQPAALPPRTRRPATGRPTGLFGRAPGPRLRRDRLAGRGPRCRALSDLRLGRIEIPGAAPHPSGLVESVPMASVAPPAPSYRPRLPASCCASSACPTPSWKPSSRPERPTPRRCRDTGGSARPRINRPASGPTPRARWRFGAGFSWARHRLRQGPADRRHPGRQHRPGPDAGAVALQERPCWRTRGATGWRSAVRPATSSPKAAGNRARRSVSSAGFSDSTYATLRQPAPGRARLAP